MTLRELVWMAEGRREFEGDLVAWLIRCIPEAIWSPKDLPASLNPFRGKPVESEAMRAYKASLTRRQLRVLAGG